MNKQKIAEIFHQLYKNKEEWGEIRKKGLLNYLFNPVALFRRSFVML